MINYRKIYILLIIVMVIGDIFIIADTIMNNDFSRTFQHISLFFILFLPLLIEKIFKTKLSYELKLLYYIFIFVGMFLGMIVNLYEKTNWYDKAIHGISGVLTAIVGYLILFNSKKDSNMVMTILFIFGFSMLVASIWEFTEFFGDISFNMTSQRALETGVTDTMLDMIMAFVGTALFSIIYCLGRGNKGFKSFFNKLEIK